MLLLALYQIIPDPIDLLFDKCESNKEWIVFLHFDSVIRTEGYRRQPYRMGSHTDENFSCSCALSKFTTSMKCFKKIQIYKSEKKIKYCDSEKKS